MRLMPVALSVLLAGCAGNVADYVGSRSGIVSPQLIRFGLTLDQSRCVGERLGDALNPLQLRQLARVASATKTGADPARLTIDDLVRVSGRAGDAAIRPALVQANSSCAVTAAPALPAPVAAADPGAPPAAASTGMARQPAWLNLGAAPSGQSIAVDAATIEQQASTRTAWFRLTEPGAAFPGQNTYHLRVDCSTRTISEKARRKPDGTGATEEVAGDDKPVAIERNTVMEIAWLALCT